MIGRTLANYRVTDRIGAGGMGEVYLAEDTTLGRSVALKVLPKSTATDATALARLEREARLLASVAHPSIATVHGLHDVDGVMFIAMEYLGGGSLEARMRRGRMTVDEVVAIGIDIASALEAAHARDILHRDVKPSNVAFDDEGRVKLLDFGIGRAVVSAAPLETSANTVALDPSLTQAGSSVGTPAYMSPEQVRAEELDARSDIWSFGVLLFWMLTGKSPFGGNTTPEVFASVLERELDFSLLPADVPVELRRLVRRCLVRDRSQRLQSIGDARVVLQEVRDGDVEDLPMAGSRMPRARLGLFALLVPVALAAGWWMHPASEHSTEPSAYFEIAAPDSLRFVTQHQRSIALSHDGETIVFTAGTVDDPWDFLDSHGGETALYIRRLDEWMARKIPGTEGATSPIFSPDDQWIAFDKDRKVMRVRSTGSEPEVITDTHSHWGMDWSDDDRIALRKRHDIGVVPASGGEIDLVYERDPDLSESVLIAPCWLPGSRHILFGTLNAGNDIDYETGSRIRAVSLESGEAHTVLENATDPRYGGGGTLFFAREASIYAVDLDLETALPLGEPVKVLDGVNHAVHAALAARETTAAQFDVSPNGTMAFMPGSVFPERPREVVWVDRAGKATPTGIPAAQYTQASLSPDESRVLVRRAWQAYDILTFDIDRSILRRQASDGTDYGGVWGPGPNEVTITGSREGQWVLATKTLDTDAASEQIIELPERIWPQAWSATGDTLIANAWGSDLALVDETQTLHRITDTRTPWETGPKLSPNGRWLVYQSREPDAPLEVFVRRFPSSERTYQVSVDGGRSAQWSHDGNEIFYWVWDENEDSYVVKAADFSIRGGEPVIGSPRTLFPFNISLLGTTANYSVASDGRFLLIKETPDSLLEKAQSLVYPDRIRVATNWKASLR